MLVDAIDDAEFQRYLDRVEQELYVEMSAAMTATIRIHVNRNGLRAEIYLTKRGADLLFHYYRKIHRDQYNAISDDLETKAAGQNNFLSEQENDLRARAGKQITGISENLRTDVSNLLLEGIKAGKSNQQIAREINAAAPTISRKRAAVIARTETHQSAMAAINETLKYKKIVPTSKTWWSSGDDRVRATHKEVHGMTVDYAEPFSVGGSLLRFPGDDSLGADPSQTIGCRCACLFDTGA